jgi:hypothetical protein
MKPITGLTRKRAKAGMTIPAAPRMTRASLRAEWVSSVGAMTPYAANRANVSGDGGEKARDASL